MLHEDIKWQAVWIMVVVTGAQNQIGTLGGNTFLFLILSGIATGVSWMCYYRGSQDGFVSVVVSIDKLNILVTVAFSWLVFHEKLTARSGWSHPFWKVKLKVETFRNTCYYLIMLCGYLGKDRYNLGKDLNGKELGRGIYQRKDKRYEARILLKGSSKPISLYGYNLRI